MRYGRAQTSARYRPTLLVLFSFSSYLIIFRKKFLRFNILFYFIRTLFRYYSLLLFLWFELPGGSTALRNKHNTDGNVWACKDKEIWSTRNGNY